MALPMGLYIGQSQDWTSRYALITSHPKPAIRVASLSPMASAICEDKQQGSSGKRVAVIGAGVSGLSAAFKLKLHGLNVTVFEADDKTGGKLRSISREGLIWDEGANTMTESEPAVGLLLDELGLRDKQQYPLSQDKRYIAKNGVPVLLPSNPVSLVRSKFLSAGAKLHILLEPFLWKRKISMRGLDTEESVGAFFERHFGKEVVDYLIDPFVAGTSGGDPESLSMRHVFPELWNLEERFGSIITGAIQSKFSAKKAAAGRRNDNSANKKPKNASFSFQGGMQALTNALCNELGKDELKLQSKVLELSCRGSEHSPLDYWSVSYKSDERKLSCQDAFDALIVTTANDGNFEAVYNTTPCGQAPLSDVKQMKITRRGNPFSLEFVPEVSYLPMSVVITTFKRESVKRPLEGFGVLVPCKEQQNGLKTLGTLFSSMMFPDRAPNDVYLYTTFVGGSRNRELARASTDELKQLVSADLRKLLGADGEPAFVNHYCWSKAFPLYGRNYNAVFEAIDKMEKELPGLFYAGNHKGGLSVGKAISSGCEAADFVISYLNNNCSDAKENTTRQISFGTQNDWYFAARTFACFILLFLLPFPSEKVSPANIFLSLINNLVYIFCCLRWNCLLDTTPWRKATTIGRENM